MSFSTRTGGHVPLEADKGCLTRFRARARFLHFRFDTVFRRFFHLLSSPLRSFSLFLTLPYSLLPLSFVYIFKIFRRTDISVSLPGGTTFIAFLWLSCATAVSSMTCRRILAAGKTSILTIHIISSIFFYYIKMQYVINEMRGFCIRKCKG